MRDSSSTALWNSSMSLCAVTARWRRDLWVQRLLDGLTELWEAGALQARREISPGSPVAVLDRLLRSGAEQ
jgi:hypothetical protein